VVLSLPGAGSSWPSPWRQSRGACRLLGQQQRLLQQVEQQRRHLCLCLRQQLLLVRLLVLQAVWQPMQQLQVQEGLLLVLAC